MEYSKVDFLWGKKLLPWIEVYLNKVLSYWLAVVSSSNKPPYRKLSCYKSMLCFNLSERLSTGAQWLTCEGGSWGRETGETAVHLQHKGGQCSCGNGESCCCRSGEDSWTSPPPPGWPPPIRAYRATHTVCQCGKNNISQDEKRMNGVVYCSQFVLGS